MRSTEVLLGNFWTSPNLREARTAELQILSIPPDGAERALHYRPFSLIGIYLAVGPIAEIVAMLMAGRLLARFEPRRVMTACCLIGFVRWCGLVAPPWPALVALLQTLHLVTFGLGYVCFVVLRRPVEPSRDRGAGAEFRRRADVSRDNRRGSRLDARLEAARGRV